MKKKGFSLIELLISLITISVILACMVPVVTHKMKHSGISIGTKKLSMTCPNTVGDECTLCLGNQCIACPINCGAKFKNTLTCKCESCTIANCTNCNSGANQCDSCKSGCSKISNNECKCCPDGQYITGSTCTTCPKGYRCSNNTATKCTGTQYQDETGKNNCKECEGVVSNDRTSCSNCASGTYWHSTNKNCTTCNTGHKCSGDNLQTPCNGNQYQNESGKAECKNCSGVLNSYRTECRLCNYFASNCTACTFDKCTSWSCASGYYETNTGCAVCSSKYGSNCATCNTTSCLSYSGCNDGMYLSNGQCYNCPKGCTKCTSATSCSECSYDYTLSNNTCLYDPCTRHNAVLISNGTTKFCMKRYNVGDDETTAPSYMEGGGKCAYTISSYYDCTSTSELETKFPGWDYNGCNRHTCNWQAANVVCSLYGQVNGKSWGLPTGDQLWVLKARYDGKYDNLINSLQFCNGEADFHGIPWCKYHNTDFSSNPGIAYPDEIWGTEHAPNARTAYSISTYKQGLNKVLTSNSKDRYHSVRCVLTLD